MYNIDMSTALTNHRIVVAYDIIANQHCHHYQHHAILIR